MQNCTLIDANPDVSGIGIRVNLYITMLLMAVIPEIPGLTTPLLEVLTGGAGISGVALLITAIVQTSKKSLSLYHAIFIIHMLFFTGIMVAPSGRYRGNMTTFTMRMIVAFIMTYGSFILFTGYAFYVWATAPTFGNFNGCNDHIKYIFFFKSVRATVGWLRKLWMAGLGLTLGLLFIVPLASCVCCCIMASSDGETRRVGYSPSVRENSSKFSKPLAVIYGVVMLELYVKRNKHLIRDGEQQWTFGQIMALVQIISTFNEVLHFLISLWSPNDGESYTEPVVELPVSNSTNSKSRRRWLLWKSKHNDQSGGLELQKVQVDNQPTPTT